MYTVFPPAEYSTFLNVKFFLSHKFPSNTVDTVISSSTSFLALTIIVYLPSINEPAGIFTKMSWSFTIVNVLSLLTIVFLSIKLGGIGCPPNPSLPSFPFPPFNPAYIPNSEALSLNIEIY